MKFNDWLAGLIETRGCFYMGIIKRGEKTYEVPKFKITNKNLKLLKFLKKTLKMGHIIKKRNGYYSYWITKSNDVKKFIEMIEDSLLIRKKEVLGFKKRIR